MYLKLRGAPNLSGHPSFGAVVDNDNKDRRGEDGVPHHVSEIVVGCPPRPKSFNQPSITNWLQVFFADLSRMRNLEFE